MAISSLVLAGMAPSAIAALSQARKPSQAAAVNSPNFFSFLRLLESYIMISTFCRVNLPAPWASGPAAFETLDVCEAVPALAHSPNDPNDRTRVPPHGGESPWPVPHSDRVRL